MKYIISHRKKYVLILLAVFVTLNASAVSYAQKLSSEIPVEAIVAADRSFGGWVEDFFKEGYTKSEIPSSCNLTQLFLGKAFRYMYIAENNLNTSKSDNDDFLSFQESWVFPVMCNDIAILIAEVKQVNGVWKMISLGRSRLAQNYTILKDSIDPSLFKKLRGFTLMYNPNIATAVFGDTNSNLQFFPLDPENWDEKMSADTKGYVYYDTKAAKKIFKTFFAKKKSVR